MVFFVKTANTIVPPKIDICMPATEQAILQTLREILCSQHYYPPMEWEKRGFPGGSVGRALLPKQETQVRSLGWEDPRENEVAAQFSILAREIPRTEETGGPQSMRSQELDTT